MILGKTIRNTVRQSIKIIFVFFLAILSKNLAAQEMLGVTLGNYSGVNGIQLNPSVMNSSKNYLDVNFLSGDLFLENNYLFIDRKDYGFNKFFQRGYELPSHDEEFGTSDRMFYWDNSHTGKDAYFNLRLNGPGAMLVHGRHAFALTTSIRSVMSVNDLPYDIANFAYLGLNYTPQHNINYKENRPFRAAEMTWAEIGIGYAYDIYQKNYNKISVGIQIKKLLGYSGAYAYVTNMDYIVPNDSTIIVNNIKANMGYSLPMAYDGKDFQMYDGSTIKGGGWGFDVGLTYTRLKRLHQRTYFTTYCAQTFEPYEYRIGLALIDLGSIKFKEHASKIFLNDKASYWENVRAFDYMGVSQLVDTVSYRFFGNDTTIYVDDNFRLWLPTAISVQADYHVYRNWFVNGSLIMGVPLAQASLVRPAVVSLTPRYESHWFQADLPISLYDWYLPRVGLSLRFWYLTIGTEKLGQFFRFRDATGMDFYFSLNFFLEKGSCRNFKQKGCADREYQTKSKF